MKWLGGKRRFSGAALGLALWAGFAAAAEPVAPGQTVRLFNGRDLAGWTSWLVDARGDDPRRVFSVQDGLLRISGDGFGYLSTAHAYRDYRLVVEFRWGQRNWRGRQGKARDSGIFLHSAGPNGNSFDGGGAFKAAIECQVMEGAVGDLMLIAGKDDRGRSVPVRLAAPMAAGPDAEGWRWWDPAGQLRQLDGRGRLNWRRKDPAWVDRLGFRGAADVESPAGQWTRVECRCEGSRVAVRVNDTLVNEAQDVYPSAGPILLQCEGSEIFFRRVELHPLSRPLHATSPGEENRRE